MAWTDNLISYWKLDEASGTRYDSHGTNHLTPGGVTSQGTGNTYANCLSLEIDTPGDLMIATNASLTVADADMTYACWINIESKDFGFDIGGKGIGATTSLEWALQYNQSFNRFLFKGCSGAPEVNQTAVIDGGDFGGGNAPSLSTWILLVCWHDSTNNVLGIATSANSMTDYTMAYSYGLYDGGGGHFGIPRSPYYGSYFDGLVGPAMFWKRVLTSDERTALYNGGSGLTYAAMSGGGGGSPASTNMFFRRRR